jgi:hypothetical protein
VLALSRRNTVKSAGEIMEVLEAFDLTGSFRGAAELAGCSHHTVARYVAAREAGGRLDKAAERPLLIDEFLPKVQEWVRKSGGNIRADKAHEKLLAMGPSGVRTHDPTGCPRDQGRVQPRPDPGPQAVGHGARDVVAVRLRRRSRH